MVMFAHIVATDRDGLIGVGNDLPWGRNNLDMDFFKKKTEGHVVVMGYNTILSLPKKLKNRFTVGVRKTPVNIESSEQDNAYQRYVSRVDRSIILDPLALVNLKKFHGEYHHRENTSSDIIFIAGGGKLYESTLDDVDIVYQNVIMADFWIDNSAKRTYYPIAQLEMEFVCIHESKLGFHTGDPISRIWIRKKNVK